MAVSATRQIQRFIIFLFLNIYYGPSTDLLSVITNPQQFLNMLFVITFSTNKMNL